MCCARGACSPAGLARDPAITSASAFQCRWLDGIPLPNRIDWGSVGHSALTGGLVAMVAALARRSKPG